MFRSARPDFITETDLLTVKYQLGVKYIVDCRSVYEYQSARQNPHLDGEYPLFSVKLPAGRNYRMDEPVKVKQVHTAQTDTALSNCRHYMINFFSPYYILNILLRAPWYIKLCSLLFLLYDYMWSTGYKHFVRLITKSVLNKSGLIGQYKDMIDYSQRSICAALKLLTVEDDLSALVNCAHGKDRTGIVCALVLYCLGKPIDYIIADYTLSEKGLFPLRDRLNKEMVEFYHFDEEFMSAKAETLEGMFHYIIEKYGSVEAYMKHIGFGPKEQEMLRQKF